MPSPATIKQRGTSGLPTGGDESIVSPSDTACLRSRQQSAIAASSGWGKPNNSEDNKNACRGAPLSSLSLTDLKARDSYSRESATTSTDSIAGTSVSQNSWTDSLFVPDRRRDRDTVLRKSLQSNMTSIRKGFELQRSFTAELFFCYEPRAFEELFAILTGDPRFPIASPRLCEMFAVAVTSGQYVRDLIEPDVLDCWYGTFQSKRTHYLTKGKTESLQMPHDNNSMVVSSLHQPLRSRSLHF